jgi:two-component system, NtrC family, nitrogen regulation sensor histidine kinase NtrY
MIASWQSRIVRGAAYAIGISAFAAGIATYAAMTNIPPFGDDPETIRLILTLDLVLLSLMAAGIAARVLTLWRRRQLGLAGAKLHVRLVVVFSLLAVMPAVIVSIFAAAFFYLGMQAWFSERVKTAVDESLAVSRAYLEEHQQNIRADALAMASDINREGMRLAGNAPGLGQLVASQAALRSLTEAVIFDSRGRILARTGLSFALEFEPIPDSTLQRARDGDVVLMIGDGDDRVRALVYLDRFFDAYLFVGRFVEPRVLDHMNKARRAVDEYAAAEGRRDQLQYRLVQIFVVMTLLLLLVAISVGLNLAARLVGPIGALIDATEKMRGGDLSVRVTVPNVEGELAQLGKAFNRMARQIETQQGELIDANGQLDFRRRFTEAVLSGVSAGVIGVDADGCITMLNQSARQLLDIGDIDVTGHSLALILPEMAGPLSENNDRRAAQIDVRREGKTTKTFSVRVTRHSAGDDIRSRVVTFEDVSDLLAAQRKAAWSDVARRIAHEIKNPLTPIQLSAERLRRKYQKDITSDPEIFENCIDTIIRQVDDIGRMVDEFSAFARMPLPTLQMHDLAGICQPVIFLQSNAHPQITYRFLPPDPPISTLCDPRQIAQAITNLLQNAADAIEGRDEDSDGDAGDPGQIDIQILADLDHKRAILRIQDNGKGLPMAERDRLTEPYVTTRAKGTGLGLAIVKKIAEDHAGHLHLSDRPDGLLGAVIDLDIPLTDGAAST